jgi:hypothetical protein
MCAQKNQPKRIQYSNLYSLQIIRKEENGLLNGSITYTHKLKVKWNRRDIPLYLFYNIIRNFLQELAKNLMQGFNIWR